MGALRKDLCWGQGVLRRSQSKDVGAVRKAPQGRAALTADRKWGALAFGREGGKGETSEQRPREGKRAGHSRRFAAAENSETKRWEDSWGRGP